jgi:glycosyltransferase involved in cell wall biosynthesis/SAM-dependent methyltransferase
MEQFITHICQISKECTLLNENKMSEPYLRQCDYLSTLKEKVGQDAIMTIVILTNNIKPKVIIDGDLHIVAIPASFWVRFIGVFFTLRKIHKTSPINVLTSQVPIDEGWVTLLFGKIFRIPVIAQVHFDIFDKEAIKQILGEGLRGKIRFFLFKKTVKFHHKIRVVGSRITKNLLEQCSCKPDQIQLLPVMVPLLNKPTKFIGINKTDSSFRILYVGRLVAQKNLFFLLKIAAHSIKKDKSLLFDIVGSGPLKKDLEVECNRLEIQNNVIFHGEIPNADLPNFYQNADIFILTSHYEGFGRVVVEAGAYRLPVLSTRITGPEDIIEDRYNGYLLEINDRKGFVEKIFFLKNNPEERIAMGLNNYNRINERYSPIVLKEKWVDLLLNVLPKLPFSMIMVRKRTLHRWKKMWNFNGSLWRTLTYDIIEEIKLKGLSLDIGAGKNNSYHHILQIDGQIETINIDPNVEPTYVFDLNKAIPLASEIYDNVISLNTFEHIYEDELAISESIRVLKEGGNFHFFVPFLYKIHAEPNDYHRKTGFWWNQKLIELGINQHNFHIETICWNKTSSIISSNGKRLSKIDKLLLLVEVIKDSRINSDRLSLLPINALFLNYPLGYYISGVK